MSKVYFALTEASKGNVIYPLYSQKGIMGELQFHDKRPSQFLEACHRKKRPLSIENL